MSESEFDLTLDDQNPNTDDEKMSFKNMTVAKPEYIAFDLETEGFTVTDRVTAAGFKLGELFALYVLLPDDVSESDVGVTEESLETALGEHDEVDDPTVNLTFCESENDVVVGIKQWLDSNIRPHQHVLATFNGYNRHGGFDYKMLAQATHYANDVEENPLKGRMHVDLMQYFDKRSPIINTTVEEIALDSITGRSLNKKPQGELADELENTFNQYLFEQYGVDEVNAARKSLQTRYEQIFDAMDEPDKGKALDKAVETVDSELTDVEVRGLFADDWGAGNKGDTEETLELIEPVLELDFIQQAAAQWFKRQGMELPTTTRSTLDGVYDILQSPRGETEGDSIDPFNGDSEKAVTAFEEGELEDLLLHLADDLIMTSYLSTVMKQQCPQDKFRIHEL